MPVKNAEFSFLAELARYRVSAILFYISICLIASNASAGNIDVGVYYFPGWKDNQPGATYAKPWNQIVPFPEREPLLGWYKEGSPDIMKQQLSWMAAYGLDFVVFDWYFEGQQLLLEHAIRAYMSIQQSDVKFSLLWANHGERIKNTDDWEKMVGIWISDYFSHPNYLVIDEKPVVFVFSADRLKVDAARIGLDAKELLDRAQGLARARGLKGIYFVAGTVAGGQMAQSYAEQVGFSALSAYNYISAPDGRQQGPGYEERDQIYRAQWNEFAKSSHLPLIVPMTSGWDRKPWGGSIFDNSISTPDQFMQHLLSARQLMEANSDKGYRYGVICCWNEFGEGSFIEPTKSGGFGYLEQVRKIFNR
jgi:hypothetical protein